MIRASRIWPAKATVIISLSQLSNFEVCDWIRSVLLWQSEKPEHTFTFVSPETTNQLTGASRLSVLSVWPANDTVIISLSQLLNFELHDWI